MSDSLLRTPGRPGAFGALIDECARAAEDFCRAVEALPLDRFLREVPSSDPDCTSIRAVCAHVIGAAYRHADYIRTALDLPCEGFPRFDPALLIEPADVRSHLAEGTRYVEETLGTLHTTPEEMVAAMTFRVRWGPIYDPEMMMEHAIVHLLRHRRQIERWPV